MAQMTDAGLCGRIEPATAEDAAAVAAIHVASWRAAYRDLLPADFLAALAEDRRALQWAESIRLGSPEVWIARRAGSACGFVAFDRSRDPDASAQLGEIWALYLAPDAWNQNIGAALCERACMRLALRGCGEVMLWVFARNRRARGFYERMGFCVEPDSAKRFELGATELEEVRYRRGLSRPTTSAPDRVDRLGTSAAD